MNYNVPIFNPISARGEDYYHPSNEAARLLVQVQHIYEDIEGYFSILSKMSDSHERLLIGKSIITECVSLDKALRQLVNVILREQSGYEISNGDSLTIRSLWRTYKAESKKSMTVFKDVRNKIAAHREMLPLAAISGIVDKVDFRAILHFLSPVPPLFNFIKELNVYEWTKVELDEQGYEVHAYVQPFTQWRRVTFPA